MGKKAGKINNQRGTIYIGKKNNIYQHIIVLKENRHKRHRYQEIFVEGVRNINNALKHGWIVKHWIYQTGKSLSNWANNLIQTYPSICDYSFVESLIDDISGKNEKSELMAIFEMKKMVVTPSSNPFILLCNKPSKKGNLGSIIRSADSFGCDGIIVTGHAVDIYDPEVIIASMGSYFSINIQKLETNQEVVNYITELRQKYPDLQVIATTEKGEDSIRDLNYTSPILLLMGNETDGLSMFYWDICDKKVKIPMVGEASSFNLACATTIFLYEIFSQRNC